MVFISTRKFFKDENIAQALRKSQRVKTFKILTAILSAMMTHAN